MFKNRYIPDEERIGFKITKKDALPLYPKNARCYLYPGHHEQRAYKKDRMPGNQTTRLYDRIMLYLFPTFYKPNGSAY